MKRDYAILLYFALAALVFPLAIDNPYYLTVAIVIGIYAIIASGLNMLMGLAGQVSLGHAAFYAMGAYFSGVLTATHHYSPLAAAAIALAATAVIAFAIGFPTLKLEGHYLAMATLGIGVIVQKLIMEFSKITGGNNGLTDIPRFELFGFKFKTDLDNYYLVWGVAFALVALSVHLVHSRIGRACRAIHESRLAAEVMGVNVERLKVQIFVLSACYASIAGSLYAYYQRYLDPGPFGFHFSVELVVMVVLGGLSSVWGGLLGALMISLLSEYISEFIEYGPIIYGLILIVMILAIPGGVAGLLDWISKLLDKKPEETEA